VRTYAHALPLLLLIGCAADLKAPPTDEPEVDDGKADSFRYPTLIGPIVPGGQSSADFTSSERYVAFTVTLEAGESISVWAGGTATAGGSLDTVAYLYGPKDAYGRRGRYLARNDDRSADSLSSRIDTTASAGAGQYLLVVTTYTKPDPGHIIVETDCDRCFRPWTAPDAPAPTAFLDVRPFANPEIYTAGGVDDLLAVLDADVAEGDPLTIASDIQALWGGRKWPLDVVDRVDQAVHGALPWSSTFAGWPARAQGILLTTDRVFEPTPTSFKPPDYSSIADDLAARWSPDATWGYDEINALGWDGWVYGWVADVAVLLDGTAWVGHEYFTRTGRYLGDFGGDFDEID